MNIPKDVQAYMLGYETEWQRTFQTLTADMCLECRNRLEDHIGLLVYRWVSQLLDSDMVGQCEGQPQQQPLRTIGKPNKDPLQFFQHRV